MRPSPIGIAVGVVFAVAAIASSVQAKDYPEKPVRIVVAYAPGGVTDVLARIFAPKLSEILHGRFYVENLPGAGGDIGTARAAAAPADGTTILFTPPDFLTSPALKAKAPYDPIASFAPVTLVATSPGVISVHSSLGVSSLQELFALLKGNPGKYSYATPGYGTLPHLAAERLLRLARGLDVIHVPFQGFGPAITSTVAGHTTILTGGAPSLIAPHVSAGTLRALAVTSNRRSPELPDVPTKEEAGASDWDAGFWGGVLVPAGTPRNIIDVLHSQIVQIMMQPEVKDRLRMLDFEPIGSPPDEFAAWLKSEYAKWGHVVRQANLKIE
jgi:tripartite-type tricarboxylate transporter receptor subunit TctC